MTRQHSLSTTRAPQIAIGPGRRAARPEHTIRRRRTLGVACPTAAAIKYSHFVGDRNLGADYCYGTGREPRLVPSADETRLESWYDLINQVGLDIRYTSDAWPSKFEGIVREGQGDSFAAAVGGFEDSFFQVFETAALNRSAAHPV